MSDVTQSAEHKTEHIAVGRHELWYFAGQKFNADTCASLILINVLLFVFFFLVNRSLRRNPNPIYPRGIQHLAEMAVLFCRNIIESMAGHKGSKYAPFFGTLFLFILFCNYSAMIPINYFYEFGLTALGHLPEIKPPTADVNTTAALALWMMLLVHFIGLKEHGFKHLVQIVYPNPMNIIEEFARPFSLTIRLFGNLFAHETIMFVLLGITAFPIIYPLPIIFLGLITGAIQAYIFSVLGASYIGHILSDHEH